MRNRTIFPDKTRKTIQQIRKSCPSFHPSISTIPQWIMSEDEFNYDYYQFTRDLPIAQEVKDNLKYLFQLYSRFCQAGGLVYVIANDMLGKIIWELSIKFPEIKSLAPENIVQHYIKFDLFSYEIVLKTGKRISNDKLMSLQLPKFIPQSELSQYFGDLQKGLQLYNQDIVVLNSLCNFVKFDPTYFNLTKVFQVYQDEVLKVFIQDIDQKDYVSGKIGIKSAHFDAQKNVCENLEKCSLNLGIQAQCKLFSEGTSNRLKESLNQLQMSLKQFNTYFNTCHSLQEKNHFMRTKLIRNDNQKHLFGFQLDPKDQFLIGEIYKKFKDTFLCYKQKYNLLSYADEDIIGVTLPKFQIQTEGNWQGGTQQPFGISKININFGPDCNQWYCISGEHLNKFYAVIKSQYGISAERIQGQWFEDIDWFIERKIPIKKVCQKKGDAVIIGNGSIFWQKSKGKSLHASWNFMNKSEKQIVAAITKYTKIRQTRNQTTTPISKGWLKKIPLKAIFFRTLNHEQTNIKSQGDISSNCLAMMREWLKKWLAEVQKFLNQLIIRQDITNCRYKYYYLHDAQFYCSYCQNQILNYFLNNNGLSCLECTSKCFVAKRSMELKDKNIYFRYEPFWVTQLMYYGHTRTLRKQLQYRLQYQQLCNGFFVGGIQNCVRIQRKFMENEPPELLQTENEWQNCIQAFNQQQSNNLQTLFSKKVLSLIEKAKKFNLNQNMMQSLPKDFNIQTDLSLLCPATDKDIEIFVSTQNKSQKKFELQTNITYSPYKSQNSSDISQSSLKRKEKRSMNRQSSEKSDNQFFDDKYGGSMNKQSIKQRNNYRQYQEIIKENSNASTRCYPNKISRDREYQKRYHREPEQSYQRSRIQKSKDGERRKQRLSYSGNQKHEQRRSQKYSEERLNNRNHQSKVHSENYRAERRHYKS